MRILLVEDDRTVADRLHLILTDHHFAVETSVHGKTALDLVQQAAYDLILLDLTLPDIDGITLCRQLRTEGNQTPILMLTAKNSPYDRVAGLEAGADDYLSKPFYEAELLARIRALLRRRLPSLMPALLQWERLEVDVDSRKVCYDGLPIHLTPKEYGILELFLQFPRRIFSRSAILDQVWGVDAACGERAVNTQIRGLRQKLRAAGMKIELIESIYGLGYRLLAPPEPTGSSLAGSVLQERAIQVEIDPLRAGPAPGAQDYQLSSSLTLVRAEIQSRIAQAWVSFRETLQPRMALLESAIDQGSQGRLTPEVRHQAQAEAHRLVGSFGSLGFPEGSTLARILEDALQFDLPLDRPMLQHLAETLQTLKQKLAAHDASLNQEDWTRAPIELASELASVIPAGGQTLIVMTQDPQLRDMINRLTACDAWQSLLVTTQFVTTLAEVQQLVSQKLACIAMVDLTLTPAVTPDAEAIQQLSVLTEQQVPVVVILSPESSLQSPIDRLHQRVHLTRLGARAILAKPIEPTMLLKGLAQAIESTPDPHASILLVDDDPQILATIVALLEPWGLQVTPLENPKEFWEILNTCQPDLLILDIELPEISGFDLCRVVRSDPDWADLPIIFLSAHTDRATVTQVFNLGADDYVRKPIVEPELIARILNRLRKLSSRDRGT
ncbi:response regulator [Alkalinema pantanalense CENA528]|uniref:response regulator n=1 Tax=Alkalinema pantanalense TaxID=1620705 RepID=UPI003D6EB892